MSLAGSGAQSMHAAASQQDLPWALWLRDGHAVGFHPREQGVHDLGCGGLGDGAAGECGTQGSSAQPMEGALRGAGRTHVQGDKCQLKVKGSRRSAC